MRCVTPCASRGKNSTTGSRKDFRSPAQPVHARIELEGVVLAESWSPVVLFETGLPARYYLNPVWYPVRTPRTVPNAHRVPVQEAHDRSVSVQDKVHPELARMCSFPTRQVLPIAGLIAFLDEKVDVFIDNVPLLRPSTHMRTWRCVQTSGQNHIIGNGRTAIIAPLVAVLRQRSWDEAAVNRH
jgi:uncharacterized protein (DUF427 family)